MAKKKESKQKKMNVRVDFTPMVDMMMLLITFFMLCTSLAKPQAMHLTMPAKDQNLQAEDKDKSKTDQTVTIYLGANDKIYYYIINRKEDFGNPEFLHETTYGKEGIRNVLKTHRVAPTGVLMDARRQLQAWYDAQPKANKEVNDSIYDRAMIMIKKGHVDIVSNNELVKSKYEAVDRQMKDGTENANDMVPVLSINIKPADESTYENLVTILDEMQICCVGKYVIDNINEKDQALLEAAGVDLSR
jgi:hypothetical protein